MSRKVMLILLVLLLLMPAARADAVWRAGHKEALQAAGRATGVLLASAEAEDHQSAFVAVQDQDCMQCTILEKDGQGRWSVTAWNDTLPLCKPDGIDLAWQHEIWLDEETGEIRENFENGDFFLELERKERQGMEMRYDSYQGYHFKKLADGGWVVSLVQEIPFEEAIQDHCPNWWLALSRDVPAKWQFKYYEAFRHNDSWDRTDVLRECTLTQEEMTFPMDVMNFDHEALDVWIRNYFPDEDQVQAALEEEAASRAPRPGSDYPIDVTVYYNPDGGKYYHSTPVCPSVNEKYWPLVGFPMKQINEPPYAVLVRCPYCDAPERP